MTSYHVHVTREGVIADVIRDGEITDTNLFTYQELLSSLSEEE